MPTVARAGQAGTARPAAPWAWLAGLTTLALVLRAVGLNSGLWYDEILTLQESVRVPLWQIVTHFPSNNQHTLFSVLAHLSSSVFGEQAWSVRLPAMLLGAATVPALYLFAREVAGQSEALLASGLLAVSYHHVWFSQNARGYSALGLFTVVSSWCLLRGLRRQHAADFVWYGVTAALGVYTHLTMVFLVISHALLCAWSLGLPDVDPDRLRRWRLPLLGFAVTAGITAILYAPLVVGVEQFFVERESHNEVATPAWAALELIRGLHLGVGAWSAGAAGAGLVMAGLWSYFKQSPLAVGLFVLPGVVTVAGAVALHRPIFPRFLFFLAGFAVMIVVRGALELVRLFERARPADPAGVSTAGVSLIGVMAMVSTISLVPNYQYPKQDFDGPRRFVTAHRADGEPIVTVGAASVVYRTYYREPWVTVNSVEALERVRAGGRRVWVVHTLDEFIEAETPDVMRLLRAECSPEAVFHGTLNDGDVTACTLPPLPTQGLR